MHIELPSQSHPVTLGEAVVVVVEVVEVVLRGSQSVPSGQRHILWEVELPIHSAFGGHSTPLQ